MVAPATSTTESVAWTTSKALRAKVERSRVPRSGAAQGFSGIGAGGKPGRRDAEDDASEQGKQKGKGQNVPVMAWC